jgi:hypothetical protein
VLKTKVVSLFFKFAKALILKKLLLLSFILSSLFHFLHAQEPGTPGNPIIDSNMSEREAFDGLHPDCPAEIRKRQRVVALKYYSFDGKVHRGQLVVDKDLVRDIKKIFRLGLEIRFPVHTVIPVSHPDFRKNGRWDDDLSMAANNTSAFNYRLKVGGGSLSKHAYGHAIDINCIQNPYIKGTTVLPPGSSYQPEIPGTLTADHPITRKFIALGWEWGGNWTSLKDYQHFEKAVGGKK